MTITKIEFLMENFEYIAIEGKYIKNSCQVIL